MINYDIEMKKAMERIPQGEALLLHACCGPCTSAVLERLAQHFTTAVFYYNPNIAPQAEYEKRQEALQSLLQQMPTPYPAALLAGTWDEERFAHASKGLESQPEGGARCTQCFVLRLDEAARRAKQEGCQWFTTTLTVSPHKNAALLNELGQQAAARYGVHFLPSDFKKKNGYKRSIELSAQYGLYRQDYCGCVYSVRE